ncbi:hypothetical protein QYE76_016146 [Lolium multiflorum]|uniref:Reverse transcriptase domain-containing protein n=1 Tax=Lolium multiflorum TaxID=4521 RepID=A0AAD8U9F0_LOLMU|nr:hypothetical protein QYE76_016146 [Lolium multiflorum]
MAARRETRAVPSVLDRRASSARDSGLSRSCFLNDGPHPAARRGLLPRCSLRRPPLPLLRAGGRLFHTQFPSTVLFPCTESHDAENLTETPPPPIPSRGIQEITSGTLPERRIISRRTLHRHGRLRTSLVAQEEHVDVNFIKNNNFNNNAYRNNSSNNYRPYPYNNGNGYGNSYGNSYNNNRNTPPGLEAMLKKFISTQTAFNKSVEEKLGKIDILASKVDSLAADVDLLKSKVMPNENHHNKITTTANAIQVRFNDNIRLMAELRARWDREENEKLAKENNVAKVWTITTTSNVNATHVVAPPTINNKRIGVSNVSTSNAKREKLPEIAKTCDKAAEIFSNIGDDDPIALDYNDLNFDDCHISEVIKFLQKLAKSPNASAINLAFTQHITNALIKAREEKLEREASIPRKLEDGWEPIIKMKVKDFDCNALCDLGASISVMPKKIYNMLDLPPLKNCYLDVNLADHSTKKPLRKVDNVRITVNNNLVPVDFVVLDIECNASCPIILGRPFLRTVGATIDMKEGLNFSSRNLLDSAAGGTFMSITLGAATKLLDNMMINYSEWHTERAPQETPPPIPSRGIQEIASGTLPERGIISRRTLHRHGRLRSDM